MKVSLLAPQRRQSGGLQTDCRFETGFILLIWTLRPSLSSKSKSGLRTVKMSNYRKKNIYSLVQKMVLAFMDIFSLRQTGPSHHVYAFCSIFNGLVGWCSLSKKSVLQF